MSPLGRSRSVSASLISLLQLHRASCLDKLGDQAAMVSQQPAPGPNTGFVLLGLTEPRRSQPDVSPSLQIEANLQSRLARTAFDKNWYVGAAPGAPVRSAVGCLCWMRGWMSAASRACVSGPGWSVQPRWCSPWCATRDTSASPTRASTSSRSTGTR